ncbi:anti-sigma F factor [Halonatronum saccharophilum]|uniref:anti-sigma F factor n=1 Tax=Halonatronum saccharophilum TaxID=150060 RepID=UPI000483C199|nr:anti-sigma F factor [Halonatronum saccharophilum]
MENKARLIVDSISENIGLCRVTVASFAAQLDFTLSELEELKVAISEAVSNSIIHGYKEESGKIEIEMGIFDGKLQIIVEDRGCGIEDIEEACQPTYTTEGRMGLGLVFIDSFMDEFKVESKLGEGTRLKMLKVPIQDKEIE